MTSNRTTTGKPARPIYAGISESTWTPEQRKAWQRDLSNERRKARRKLDKMDRERAQLRAAGIHPGVVALMDAEDRRKALQAL